MKNTEVEAVIEAARIRGKARLALLVQEAGGFVTASQAAHLLGITRQQLDAKLPLIFIPGDGGGYPRFQFESGEMVDGVATVLLAMDVEEPRMQLSFFFLRLDELEGRRPVDALRDGALKSVVLAASHFGRHGAS